MNTINHAQALKEVHLPHEIYVKMGKRPLKTIHWLRKIFKKLEKRQNMIKIFKFQKQYN